MSFNRVFKSFQQVRAAAASLHFRAPEGVTTVQAAPTGNQTSKLAATVAAAGLGATLVANSDSLRRRQFPVNCDSGEVEQLLGKVSDFKEGEMYEIRVLGGKGSVLLSYVDGQYHVTGASCPHYSAPLVKGVVTKTHVTCPWHDAEFDLKTGVCVNGPSVDAIPVYPVSVRDGKIYTKVPQDMEEWVVPKMSKRDPSNKTVFAIVGGGPAAVAAAETLRQEGYTGIIRVYSKEKHAPYDRPVLSKNFTATPEKIALRSLDFFKEYDIEFLGGVTVKTVDAEKRQVELENGKIEFYDKVLVATGAEPRRIPAPGHQLKNIHVLRTPEDAEQIAKFAKPGTKAVVIGSSFIGMEAAASLKRHGAEVTVVGMEPAPFERVLGVKIGGLFARLLKERGINYKASSVLKQFVGPEGGDVKGVELQSGDKIEADLVVLGAGVIPNTKVVKGVKLGRDGGILVDALFKCPEHPSLFAAGDVARFPFWYLGHDVRIEHWDVAYQQGRIAAKNMLEKYAVYDKIPFFWTVLFGRSLRYAGHALAYDDIIIEGDLDKFDFAAYYVNKGRIDAVVTMGRDPLAVAVCEAMKLNILPSPADLKSGKANSETIFQLVKDYAKKGSVPPPRVAPAPHAPAPAAPAAPAAAPAKK